MSKSSSKAVLGKICNDCSSNWEGAPIKDRCPHTKLCQTGQSAEKGHCIGTEKPATGKIEAHILEVVVDLAPDFKELPEIPITIIQGGNLDNLLWHSYGSPRKALARRASVRFLPAEPGDAARISSIPRSLRKWWQ